MPAFSDNPSGLRCLLISGWSKHFYLGTICPYVFCQPSLALSHFFEVISRVFAIGERFNYIQNGKVPLLFLFIPHRPDLLALKQLYFFYI